MNKPLEIRIELGSRSYTRSTTMLTFAATAKGNLAEKAFQLDEIAQTKMIQLSIKYGRVSTLQRILSDLLQLRLEYSYMIV